MGRVSPSSVLNTLTSAVRQPPPAASFRAPAVCHVLSQVQDFTLAMSARSEATTALDDSQQLQPLPSPLQVRMLVPYVASGQNTTSRALGPCTQQVMVKPLEKPRRGQSAVAAFRAPQQRQVTGGGVAVSPLLSDGPPKKPFGDAFTPRVAPVTQPDSGPAQLSAGNSGQSSGAARAGVGDPAAR